MFRGPISYHSVCRKKEKMRMRGKELWRGSYFLMNRKAIRGSAIIAMVALTGRYMPKLT